MCPALEPPLFACEVALSGGTAIARLRGELDMQGVPELREALARAGDDGPERLVVDLSQLEFMDSSGLAVLIELTALCERDGLGLQIVNGPAPIRELFEVTGLTARFPLVDAFVGPAAANGQQA